jgi:hypothetical protein
MNRERARLVTEDVKREIDEVLVNMFATPAKDR